jgi:hypothetical protein
MHQLRKVPNASSCRRPSNRERRLSVALLGVLIAIAGSVYAVQFRYDPSLWRDHGSAAVPSGSTLSPSGLSAVETAGLAAMSLPEVYDAETLSDKINGKAELYLPAGFERLECRRFALTADPTRWMELFVYDMGHNRGAFAVYSQQRREQAQPLDLTPDAYLSSNGIFLVQGRYYLEIIGSDGSEALVEKMVGLARAFVDLFPADAVSTDERTLFPEQGLEDDSIALTAENAFGFEPFNRIYTARYRDSGHTAYAFLSRRDSEAEAAELAEAYIAYLIEYGGRRLDAPAGGPPLAIVEIMDMIEIVFHQGDVLAGIHEADDPAYALSLAGRLYRNLNEAPHEP